MQQDNNLKNKLQQLDNQQLPDLSQMDKHWKQLQSGLQGAGAGSVKKFPARAVWLIAIAALICLTVILYHNFSQKENSVAASMKEEKIIVQVKDYFNDTTILNKRDTTINTITKTKNVTGLSSGNGLSKGIDTPLLNKNYPSIPYPVDSLFQEPVINKTALLQGLLSQLKKTPNDYVINNSEDTLLDCPEGTSLLIPANSLGGGVVTVSVAEFYKRSDIILNRLTTTSDGNLLESGGMLHIEASKNGKPVPHALKIPIKFYLSDTSANMQTMKLFTGEEKQPVMHGNQNMDTATTSSLKSINWIAQPQYFTNNTMVTEVKVLDLRNEPFKTIKRKKGVIGVFNMASTTALSKAELKKVLKEKYGYYKVRFGYGQNSYFHGRLSSKIDTLTYSDIPVGDSAWVNKTVADKYKLPYSAIRTYQATNRQQILNTGVWRLYSTTNGNIIEKVKDRYSVDINSLGWINCDRFNYDDRDKINYIVDLGDHAENYSTLLIFDRIKSMITGVTNGNKVMFSNMPVGEPVKIISIGIGENNRPMMAMKAATIERSVLTGFKFEENDIPAIKSSLSTMDK